MNNAAYTKAYIALGSNLSWKGYNPPSLIEKAALSLNTLPCTTCLQVSSLYQSPPLDGSHQADYCNAVAEIKTQLSPTTLLNYLKKLEHAFGRPKTYKRWSARTLDLDILLYGDLSLNTPHLTIPHYDLKNRSFFVDPLLEINSACQLPDGYPLSPVSHPLLVRTKKLNFEK